MKYDTKISPSEIFGEYKNGNSHKASIGDNGIFEQSKINERFFVGDQWYGAKCGNSRPLVRRNVIKRIGDYKMSTVGNDAVAVNYSVEGVVGNGKTARNADLVRQSLMKGEYLSDAPDSSEIGIVTSAMSNYFKVTAERVKFEKKKEQLLRNAYISGTGIAYTYWDPYLRTGLYADDRKTTAICGDIAFEVLDIENVVFGDPTIDDVEKQSYIIISQKMSVLEARRQAKMFGQDTSEIKADGGYLSSYNSEEEQKVTVLTKFFKVFDKVSKTYSVMAVRVAEDAVIRPVWDLKIKCYPIAKFTWESRKGSAYGDSEITYLIPNQIAINRALTAQVWSALSVGMPKLLVNGDMVNESISNDPGQIIKVFAGENGLDGAMQYVNPPTFAEQYQTMISELASNTMIDCGANDAALGNMRPDNATAIIQMREAALQPMIIYRNKFYDFMEDIARIWASFWVNMYGDRYIKVEDKNGNYYLPFKADRYRDLFFTARVDVGESSSWSEAVVVATLDKLLTEGLITFEQYLERLPKGLVPDSVGLRQSVKEAENDSE